MSLLPSGPTGDAMADASPTDTRGPQRFPTLTPAELDRLRAFATVREFAAGEALERVGEPGHGLAAILSGQVEVYGGHKGGERSLIVTHHAGGFVGELAQLSGRPALVDALAATPVTALIIPPERLRALLV